MFGWFRRPKEETRVRILEREQTQLRLSEWVSDPQMVNAAHQVLAMTTVDLMLQVMENEHPAFNVYGSATIEERAILQARAEGYTMALQNLRSMGTLIQPREVIAEDFGEKEYLPA